MIRLNPTRLRRFLVCEYDWYCYVVEGIRPRVRRSSHAQDRGKALHKMIEHSIRHYAETGEVFDFSGSEGYDRAEAIYQELYDTEGTVLDEDACHSLLDAARYQIPRLNLAAWEVLHIDILETMADGTTQVVSKPAVEIELFAPLPGQREQLHGSTHVELQAIIDVVFRHRVTGEIWFIDWKTMQDAIDTAELSPYIEHNYQLAIGRMILAHHGVQVDVSSLVHLRNVPPAAPELTTKGKVTRNKARLACDWPTYRQAIIDNGEDPNAESVLKVQEHLLTAVFVRWRRDITSTAGTYVLEHLVQAAAERMQALADRRQVPIRNLRDNTHRAFKGCGGCDYNKWCTASLRNAGEPDLSLLSVDYVAKEDSPPVAVQAPSVAPYDPATAYVRHAADRGQVIEAHEELHP